MRGLREWRHTFSEGRTRLCSIFLCNLFWTSVRLWKGIRGHGWGCGGGKMRAFIWRGGKEDGGRSSGRGWNGRVKEGVKMEDSRAEATLAGTT